MTVNLIRSLDQRLIPIIAKHITASEDMIADDACLVDDLGADSLDVVELVMDIEDEFGIEIADADMSGMETPADIKRYLHKRLGDQVVGEQGEVV